MASHGCPINALANISKTSDKVQSSALHLAVENNNLEVTDVLLRNDAETEIRDLKDKTPLHLACEKGFLDIAKLLVGKGASLDARTKKNERTPIHLAFLKGHFDITQYLITCGANVTAKDINNQNLLHLASLKGHNDIVKMCIAQLQNSSLNALEDNGDKNNVLIQAYLQVIFLILSISYKRL